MRKNILTNFVYNLSLAVLIFVILALLIFSGIIDEYNGNLLVLSGIYLIVALSLNLITGFTGQLSLGQAGFMSIGAYSSAILMLNFKFPLILAVIFGGLITGFVGLIIGFPTLRLKGDYLAITTLGFGEIIRVAMINLSKLTGGAAGLKNIPKFPSSGDYILDVIINLTYIYVFAIIILAIVSNLLKSSPGRAIISVREDEIASSSMGVDIFYYKMFSFVLSAIIAGIGGGLYASYMGYINPDLFGFLNSVNYLVIVVLGGLGSLTGTVFSSVIFVYLQEWLRIFGDFRLVIFGLILIISMLFWPSGLMGTSEYSPSGFVKKLIKGQFTIESILSKAKQLLKKIISNKSRNIFKHNGGEGR